MSSEQDCSTVDDVEFTKMENCVFMVNECTCADSPGVVFLSTLFYGCALGLAMDGFFRHRRYHLQKIYAFYHHPKDLKNILFMLYIASVGLMVILMVGLVGGVYARSVSMSMWGEWAVTYMIPWSLYTSQLSLLCTFLADVARKAKKLQRRSRRTWIEYVLMLYAVCGPVVYIINVLATGVGYDVWVAFTNQFVAETGISIVLFFGARHFVKRHGLADHKLVSQIMIRLRNMTLLAISKAAFNVIQNMMEVIRWPYWVWPLQDIFFVIVMQDSVQIRGTAFHTRTAPETTGKDRTAVSYVMSGKNTHVQKLGNTSDHANTSAVANTSAAAPISASDAI